MKQDLKIGIDLRVFNVAEKYNVSQNMVHGIIGSYISRSRDNLLNGSRIDFFGLASIVPNPVCNRQNTTLAYLCYVLADELKLPWNTVFVVVREYLDCLREDILTGCAVEIRGIVDLYPVFSGDTMVTVRSCISSSVRRMLGTGAYPVDSVRVHTYRLLRDAVARLG